jgi:monoamine oxidase
MDAPAGRALREPQAASIVLIDMIRHASRRRFLTSVRDGVAASLSLWIGGCASAPAPRAPPRARTGPASVVVVGGGLAGLAAALALVERGHEVRVLEAKALPGGRILTIRTPWRDGLYVEAGATHVVADPALLALCAAMGVAVETRTPARGLARVCFVGGTRTVLPAGAPSPPEHPLRPDEAALSSEQRMARYFSEVGTFDPTLPFPPALLPLDALGGAELLRRRGASPGFLAEMDGMLGLGDTGLEGMSALSMVHQWAEIRRETALGGGGGRIAGGSDRLPAALAARLGARLITGAAVVQIAHDAGGARVVFQRRGETASLEAARVIVAIPAPVLAALPVTPALSPEKRTALAALRLEQVTRVWLEADQRFWTARGENGRARTDLPIGVVRDETDGMSGTAGILGVYATRAAARRFSALSDGERVASLLADLERVHPGLRERFVAGASKSWETDPFQRGAYAYFQPGQLTHVAPHLGRAEGRLHFAGDHTSHRPGFMHGALASARRVVAEVSQDQN